MLTADNNSHSKLWGNETNSRGKMGESNKNKYITRELPTIESKIGKSIIDVTLCFRLPFMLNNWRVLRSYSGTHHNTIHYNLQGIKLRS